jgi:hypothetical protein
MGRKIIWAPLDATVLREGYLAGRRGIIGEANPYQAGTREALAWGIGWGTGQRKQLRLVNGGRSVFTGRFGTPPSLS